jgi:hypothetical protein
VKSGPWKNKEMENHIEIALREIGCEDGRWTELAKGHVQWQGLVSAMLSHSSTSRELITAT